MIWKTQYSAILLLTAILFGCQSEEIEQAKVLKKQVSQQESGANKLNPNDIKLFAETLKLSYRVIDNVNAQNCERLVKSGQCFDAQIKLALEQPIYLPSWKIFFSNMSPILEDDSELFDISHVNGDQHYISPTSKFAGWTGMQSFEINFKAEFWHISEFDSPPNFYLVVEGHQPQIIKSTLAKIDTETGQEILPHMMSFLDSELQFKRGKQDQSVWDTAENLYRVNSINGSSTVDVRHQIIPTPLKLGKLITDKNLDISNGLKIDLNSFQIEIDNPAIQRLQKLGVKIDSVQGVPIIIEKLSQEQFSRFLKGRAVLKDEKNNPYTSAIYSDAYSLDVNQQQIKIKAITKAGAFYALQSVASLYQSDSNKLSLVQVIDYPRYAYRGFFIDVARNFRSKDFIIKLLDQMAAYKLNKFHFHLGDDEGWRLEIPGLPELTSLGANRCHDPDEIQCLSPQLASGPFSNNSNNGFYSTSEYQEIIDAASKRHIEVIPSFDMPGHSRAAVKSMQLRYRNFMKAGDKELAEEFLLSDPNDKSQYSSVQFYNDNTLNVCKASTYRFVEKVLNEVIALHTLAKQPLKTYHIGADETAGAWKGSPECKQFIKQNDLTMEQLTGYFIQRISKFLASKGIQPGGWSDGLSLVTQQEMPENVHVNVWTPLFWEGHKVAHKMANRDWKVVLSNPDVTYFDFPYQADPKERGYYWGSRFTNTRQIFEWMPDNLPVHAEIWKDRINQPFIADDRPKQSGNGNAGYSPKKIGKSYYGIQAQLWSEMVRTDQIAEYLIFPRLIALAERAWHKPVWEIPYDHRGKLYNEKTKTFTHKQQTIRNNDWINFAHTISTKEMPKLDLFEIEYRLPTPGAKLSNDILFVNSAFPGLPLQYKLGNGNWTNFSDHNEGIKVDPSQTIYVRTNNHSGSRFGRALKLNNN